MFAELHAVTVRDTISFHGAWTQFDSEGWPKDPERYEDETFARIRERGVDYWADPGRSRPGEINYNDGGRGVYFEDPNGHLLEIMTRPYGATGKESVK